MRVRDSDVRSGGLSRLGAAVATALAVLFATTGCGVSSPARSVPPPAASADLTLADQATQAEAQPSSAGVTTTSSGIPSSTASSAATPRPRSTEASGVRACRPDELPRQVGETVRAIREGGPFARRKDGVTFQNREGRLPRRASGFYREYTVPTPGTDRAGARRIVTGGNPRTNPPWMFYSSDHYETFCEITS